MELETDKLQLIDAPFHFAFIGVAVAMRAETGQAKKAAWMSGAEFRNTVMRPGGLSRSGIRLHNRGIHATFLHAADHIFLCAEHTKHAAFSEMGV
jgi:hypothetical protein